MSIMGISWGRASRGGAERTVRVTGPLPEEKCRMEVAGGVGFGDVVVVVVVSMVGVLTSS